MTSTLTKSIPKLTIASLELLPDDGNRYELIEGELFVTRTPHLWHQQVCRNVCRELDLWSRKTGLGETYPTPGIIFTDADNAIPDVIWLSHARLENLLDEGGHLTGAPELIVEVLSYGFGDVKRDKETKLELYSNQGVIEYWILDRRATQVLVYRRPQSEQPLELVETLSANQSLSSPLLPGFNCLVSILFS